MRINTSEQLAGSLFSASRQDSTESVSVQGVAVLVTVVVAGMVVVVDIIEADDVTVSLVVLVDADDVIGKVIEFVTDGITVDVCSFVSVWLKILDVNSIGCVEVRSMLLMDCVCVVPHTPQVLGHLVLANASSLQTFK